MQMLGEAFKAEVAANGGKMPPLGIKTLVRLAGRLWVKRKIFHGKQKLGGLFGIQVSLLPKPFISHSCRLLHFDGVAFSFQVSHRSCFRGNVLPAYALQGVTSYLSKLLILVLSCMKKLMANDKSVQMSKYGVTWVQTHVLKHESYPLVP